MKLLLLLASLAVSAAFYIPGTTPISFKQGQTVPLKVNALTSTHTQIPRDYYRLPFCQPEGGPEMVSESLGEFLTGNKIQSSPYMISMLHETNCQILCQVQLQKLDAAKLKLHIKYGYHHNWIIDNLPSAAIGVGKGGKEKKHYSGGFPIGFGAFLWLSLHRWMAVSIDRVSFYGSPSTRANFVVSHPSHSRSRQQAPLHLQPRQHSH